MLRGTAATAAALLLPMVMPMMTMVAMMPVMTMPTMTLHTRHTLGTMLEIVVRPLLKGLLTVVAAEVVYSTLVNSLRSSGRRFDLHTTDRVDRHVEHLTYSRVYKKI